MTAIGDLQYCFRDAVLARDLDPGLFVPTAGKGGFGIYVNAYRARLREALCDNYPILALALGDESFDQLAEVFIEASPSRFRSIRWFGDGLAAFMAQRDDLVPHPALTDLAKMDWALRGAFDAGNDAALEVGDLAALSAEEWPQQQFQLRASVSLTRLSWAVAPIWHALSEDEHAVTEAPDRAEHTLLVWRRELDCQWRSLDAIEAEALMLLANGMCYADLCQKITEADNTATPSGIALMLRRWVEDRLLLKHEHRDPAAK